MAGEAATNTIKHAVDGTWQAGRSARGVWVRVSDSGGGIKSSELPHALFKKGYSTKISLGLGFTLMLGLADQVKLSTGPRGTTIQMFKQFDDVEDAELDEMLERFS